MPMISLDSLFRIDPLWFPPSWSEFTLVFVALTLIVIFRYYLMVWPIHQWLWGSSSSSSSSSSPDDHLPMERHLTLCGVRLVTARRLTNRRPSRDNIRHERRLSDVSAAVYAFPSAWVYERFRHGVGTALYLQFDPRQWQDWAYVPMSLFLVMVLQDTHYYWAHRVMHTLPHWLYRYVHKGHHESIQPTPWASFSFDLGEAFTAAWVLPAIACFLPLHVYAVIGLLSFMTWQAIWNHAGWEIYNTADGWWSRIMITASHHNLHHTRYLCNYGLFFRFWDVLCGTDKGLQQPVKAID